MRIACSHLCAAYPGVEGPIQVLEDISLQIAEGEFVCVVGPSGCGKTSFLRCLAGLLAPSVGSLVCDGEKGDGSIGLVVQEYSLFPWMTALDNAAFALEMHRVPKLERAALARPVLQRFGLSGREHAYPHQLSSGMKQRVAVARAFLSRSTLLLMDEPFGALDAITRQRLQQELIREWTNNPRTVIFVTHDVEEALLLGSRVLVMTAQPGRIAGQFEAASAEDKLPEVKREIYALLGLTPVQPHGVKRS